MSPSDELNEKLKKAREDARKMLKEVRESNDRIEKELKAKKEQDAFVNYGTMFKLEDRENPAMSFDPEARKMVCMSCGHSYTLRHYLKCKVLLENKCAKCAMTAKEFWAGKLHRETNDD